ncbi:putative methyltransferase [Cladophialophora carrionii]|uniref:Putative methyltransferase n=1 Tax=Cladophialophora carrionii TaxID=86049 RepID=A0A1C1CTC7_9EURO|nr:putative methyltransferase [Cladophialophora carrionii]
MYHAVRLSIEEKLFFAPLTPTSVLDVGTGTGTWAIDMADEYPDADVVGTDLSPIQPSYVPPNCRFEIADADEEWTFRQRFDLVHSRVMNDTSLRDWPHFYREAFASLTPGGWVESQEFSYKRYSDDGSLPADSRITYWEDLWTQGINRIGLRGHGDPELIMQQMRDAGFINVTRLNFKMPIGPWPKDERLRKAGLFGYVNLYDGFYGLSVKVFTQMLGWTVQEMEALLAECRQELRRKDIHGYWKIWVIYAQKPFDAVAET